MENKNIQQTLRNIENKKLAEEFAEKGTLKYFLLTLGFMPDNEQVAESILHNIIRSEEKLNDFYDEVKNCVEIYKNSNAVDTDFYKEVEYKVHRYK